MVGPKFLTLAGDFPTTPVGGERAAYAADVKRIVGGGR